MSKLWPILLVALVCLMTASCGTDRMVTPPRSAGFGLSATLDYSVAPNSRVFISGSIVHPVKTDSLVYIGSVASDGHTITGSFGTDVPVNIDRLFLVLWIENPTDLTPERSMVPIKVNGVLLTAIKSDEYGVCWELGLDWGAENAPGILTLRDDRSRLIDINPYYVGNPGMGETVSELVPLKLRSSWSNNRYPALGTYETGQPRWIWTVKVLRPLPGESQTIFFRMEDIVKMRLYGCMIGGVEMKNIRDINTLPNYYWPVFEVIIDSNDHFRNPRDRDERAGGVNVTPGKSN